MLVDGEVAWVLCVELGRGEHGLGAAGGAHKPQLGGEVHLNAQGEVLHENEGPVLTLLRQLEGQPHLIGVDELVALRHGVGVLGD